MLGYRGDMIVPITLQVRCAILYDGGNNEYSLPDIARIFKPSHPELVGDLKSSYNIDGDWDGAFRGDLDGSLVGDDGYII